MKIACLLALSFIAFFGCAPSEDSPSAPDSKPPSSNQDVGYKLETVIESVQVPWSIVWDPDGVMLFTERPGRIRVFENGKLREQPLHTFTDVLARSESGLMGLCLHPNYKQNRLLYTSYAYRAG